ncbi:MAG: TIGR03862 family flavoprotein [Melioribacteraceae bacterium]|nr:TIGR03862 family flavoprotein [Melioribacteraceae bacterium]
MINTKNIAIIGGGPSGLIAAYRLASKGFSVHLFERKKSLARKFKIAGKGGLNLTYSEPIKNFIDKYEPHQEFFDTVYKNFSPKDFINWLNSLGVETFVGTSSRVFPKDKSAAEIIKTIQNELLKLNVKIHYEHFWKGFDDKGSLIFETDNETINQNFDAVLLALGGASYSFTGSDGSWKDILAEKEIKIHDFKPSNCGFEVEWSEVFKSKNESQPLKNIKLILDDKSIRGEAMITSYGIEGGVIYHLSRYIRNKIEHEGFCTVYIDLKPDLSEAEILKRLSANRGKQSYTNFLRKKIKLSGAGFGLLKEATSKENMNEPKKLAAIIKKLPIVLTKPRPIEEAISTAGGIDFSEIDDKMMLKNLPGVFVCGEMLDWEAPTGGYLLQGCFSTGVFAADGIARYLK